MNKTAEDQRVVLVLVDLFGEMDYFQVAVNNYKELRGEKKRDSSPEVVPKHLINICGLKESMNQTSFYKHFPLGK